MKCQKGNVKQQQQQQKKNPKSKPKKLLKSHQKKCKIHNKNRSDQEGTDLFYMLKTIKH